MRVDVYKVLTKWYRHVTVEPAIILYFVAGVILEFINTNLYLQKACRDNATVEMDVETPCDDEERGILYASSVSSSSKYVIGTVQAIYLILGSQWSDAAGRKRKPFIVIPIIGQIGQIILACVNVYFWYWPPIVAVLSNIFCMVASGGVPLMLNMCSTYLSDVTSANDRTMRLGLLSVIDVMCLPIGNALAGWMLVTFGFFNTYALCLISTTLGLLCACYLIEDRSVQVENPPSLLSAINPMMILDSFKVIFNKKLGKKRIVIWCLVGVHIFVWFVYSGEGMVFYLYTRSRFGWGEEHYTLYSAYRALISVMGMFFCLVILSRYYKVHDGLIGTVSGFWDTLASIGYLCASQAKQLYVVPFFDIFRGTAVAIHYSYISKYYESNEFGRLSAGLNIFSLFTQFSFLLYNFVFESTINTYPNAFFWISILVNLLVFVLYGLSYYWSKELESNEERIRL